MGPLALERREDLDHVDRVCPLNPATASALECRAPHRDFGDDVVEAARIRDHPADAEASDMIFVRQCIDELELVREVFDERSQVEVPLAAAFVSA